MLPVHPAGGFVIDEDIFLYKKSLCPCKGTKAYAYWTLTSSKVYLTSAVPPKLPILSTAPLCTDIHISLVTGENPVSVYSCPHSFKLPSQVHSVKTLIAAFPPSGSSLEINIFTYSSCSSVYLFNVLEYIVSILKCQPFFHFFVSIFCFCATVHRYPGLSYELANKQ